MDVYLNGKRLRLHPRQVIGKGGEADVFNIGNGTVLKRFKPDRHPDYQGLPHEQQAARDRIAIHQQKLRQFPTQLPPSVIAPQAWVTDRSGQIVGYTMPHLTDSEPLLKYSDRSFRQAGITTATVIAIFQDLHHTVTTLHRRGIVIGDFNDLNVLVKQRQAYLIDTDSMQFGAFLCSVFTARFVDPLLCDRTATQLNLHQPHTATSDWYAFAVMLMQCLLFVDPYGGVYKPKQPSQALPHAARPLQRITVFHPDVRYPKPAIPYQALPDELLDYFYQTFVQDRRGEFPRSLLEHLRWTQCLTCGRDHARPTCPFCTTTHSPATPAVVHRSVTATTLFQGYGQIVYATVEHNQLRWIYYADGQFWREDGTAILRCDRNPYLRWRIQGSTTWLGYQGQLLALRAGQAPQRVAVEQRGNHPLFDANAAQMYWVNGGQLYRKPSTLSLNHTDSGHYIGDVLPQQTWFWSGEQFGIGFYCAGALNVAFVFDAKQGGLNDRMMLPRWQGHLLSATCTLSQDYAWLFLTTQAHGQLHYRCVVVQAQGQVVATAQATAGDTHWLAQLGQAETEGQPKACAIAQALLIPTDAGVVKIEVQTGQLMPTKHFPDTETWVNSSSRLLYGSQGLYCINTQSIHRLALDPAPMQATGTRH